uniref:Olfactory receptor n=1 Tax=Periophthalmus magnuspinnatus TaxID=409849 RepID=A0A3B3ZFJ5_9GOBI
MYNLVTFSMPAFALLKADKYELFALFLTLYIITITLNISLITVISKNKSLHQPMNIFSCLLAANEIYGTTALLPALLSNVLSRSKDISLALCQTQLYAIHTYAITEFTVLAAMSYDRYMAICFPLTYHTFMSKRVFRMILLTWLYPLVAFFLVFALTIRLKICKNTIDKVYCLNYLLVQLSCTNTALENTVGLLSVALYTGPQLIMVIYSYVHILRICLKTFCKSKLKALRTCIPHLLSLSNYSVGCFFEIAQGRINNTLSYQTKLFLALYFLIFPPILNPVIYGLSIQVIRVSMLVHLTLNKYKYVHLSYYP